MTTEIIQQQIAELEKQQKQLEIDYHRIAGALIAYQKVLELMGPKPTELNEKEQATELTADGIESQ